MDSDLMIMEVSLPIQRLRSPAEHYLIPRVRPSVCSITDCLLLTTD